MEEEQRIKNLVESLGQATLMAKHLSITRDASQISQIVSSLQVSHQHLSDFLAQFSPLPPPADDPMQVADDKAVEGVEVRMRDFFIQSKRTKRPLSPSAAASGEETRRLYDKEEHQIVNFDPQGSRLRSLNLIYQFHS